MNKKLTSFSESALQGRSKVIKLLSIKTPELTDAQTAKVLTINAVEIGLIKSRTEIYGKTLNRWCKERDGRCIQSWAAISAVDLLIKLGWIPDTPSELAVWAHSLVKRYEVLESPQSYVKHIPSAMCRGLAFSWLELAVRDFKDRKKGHQ